MGAYALTFHDEGTEALTFWDRRLEPAGESGAAAGGRIL